MSNNDDAIPPQHPSIPVTSTSRPADSSPSTAAPAQSPTGSPSTIQTSSVAVNQAEAFLATVTTPQRGTSPANTTSVHTQVTTAATVTQTSAVSTNSAPANNTQTLASSSGPSYNGVPLSSQLVVELSKNYDDLVTDLSILRGEFDREKPSTALQVACKNEIKRRGFEQMRDHFDLGDSIRTLANEVEAREAAQRNGSLTDAMANNMPNEISRYNDYGGAYERKKNEITQMRLALEHMGMHAGEQYYTYALHSPYKVIGNQMVPLAAQPRARRKSSKIDTPKQGTPRQETPTFKEDTPMAETPQGQTSPNKRKSVAVSTPVAGLGEPEDDSRRRSGRVAKRVKADDHRDMNGTPSGKGKALVNGKMTASPLFPNLPLIRKTKTTDASNPFTPVNTANSHTPANSPYATAPYAPSYSPPSPQTEEDWMIEKSVEMESILNNIQVKENELETLKMQQSTRARHLDNTNQDIAEREARINTLEKTIRAKQLRLDAQDKSIRSNDARLLSTRDEYASAVAATNEKLKNENDVDKRLAQKLRDEKAIDARVLKLKSQRDTLEQEIKNLEREKAALK